MAYQWTVKKMKYLECNNEPPSSTQANVFSNMFSLLNPCETTAKWPVSKDLPDPFSPTPAPYPNLVSQGTTKRRCKAVTACPHPDRKHYAKNMCNNCYHREGRSKLAWACPHTDRNFYAKGKCQFCYLQQYHRSRVFGKRKKNKKRTTQ